MKGTAPYLVLPEDLQLDTNDEKTGGFVFSLRLWVSVSLMVSLFASCGPFKNKTVTFRRNDKIAYGAYYAYHSLHYFFNDAEIETNSVSPVNFYREEDSAAAYIILGTSVRPDEKELKAILNFAGSGNHVFISAIHIGQNLLDSLGLSKTDYGYDPESADSLTVSIQHPGSSDTSFFSYPGLSIDNAFTKMDTAITNVLGRSADGRANFVQFTYKNGGSLSVHLAPAAFTNFFLLHKGNKRYYDLAMSSLPATTPKIKWDEYYRSHVDGLDNSQRSFLSKLSAFLKNPVLRWAFWLAVILFALIYLFESKRKQRPVPVVDPLRNSSLDFVRTIGRLYYQRHDNKNLAAKMSAHFLGQVRTKYNLSTAVVDQSFDEKLSFKTGYPMARLQEITGFIRHSETMRRVSDDELLSFSRKIDEFYKRT